MARTSKLGRYGTAQDPGGRDVQCDAASAWYEDGVRAFALLDGIGTSDEVRAWTRGMARRVARAAARTWDPGRAIEAMNTVAVAERERHGPGVPAAVVVAITPGGLLRVAWAGDARAYHHPPGGDLASPALLTKDHNVRQIQVDAGMDPLPGAESRVVSYLGCPDIVIGAAAVPAEGRLILATDGVYEPLEKTGIGLGVGLRGGVRRAAQRLVKTAVKHGGRCQDNATATVVDLEG